LLVRRPHLGQEAGGEQLRQRARVAPVRLRRLRRVLDRLRVGEHDAIYVRLDDPGDRQRVPRRLQYDLIVCGKAPGEQLERRRRRLDSPSAAHLTALCDRDLAKVAVHVERNEAHRYLLTRWSGDEAGETTTTDPCSRHTRAVAGAANYKQRARSP
jgi:hypothetical protein